MPLDSATYHSLLNDCIDPDGPVRWLTDDLVTVTCIDGSSIVLPVRSIGSLEPTLAVAIRLKLTPLHMVIMEPQRPAVAPSMAGTADASVVGGV